MSDFIRKQQELAKKAMPQFGAVVHYLESKGQKLDAKTYERQQAQASSRLGLGSTTLFSNLTDIKNVSKNAPILSLSQGGGVPRTGTANPDAIANMDVNLVLGVKRYVNYMKKHNSHLSDQEALNYSTWVVVACKEYKVPSDEFVALMTAESSFRKTAYSVSKRKGHEGEILARGLCQIMMPTWKALGFGSYDIFDPYWNIQGGVKYYANALRQFGYQGEATISRPLLNLVLAEYNGGPEGVKYLRKHGKPYDVTANYIQNIIHYTLEVRATP